MKYTNDCEKYSYCTKQSLETKSQLTESIGPALIALLQPILYWERNWIGRLPPPDLSTDRQVLNFHTNIDWRDTNLSPDPFDDSTRSYLNDERDYCAPDEKACALFCLLVRYCGCMRGCDAENQSVVLFSTALKSELVSARTLWQWFKLKINKDGL